MRNREKINEDNRKQYQYYKEHGICTKCGNQNALLWHTMCGECIYKQNELAAKRYSRLSDEDKMNIYNRRKQIRKERDANGLCTNCGGEKKDKRYKLCLKCRLYFKRKNKEYGKTKGWKETGRCLHCGNEDVVDGKTLCPSCYEKHVKIAMKNLEKAQEKNEIFRSLNDAFWKERRSNKKQEPHSALR